MAECLSSCFVFLVGLSTSVVRSAIMLSVYALMSLGHRDKMSLNTLAFTAIVMLLVNPLSLFDVGFQMSFAAVGSILLLLPLFEEMAPIQVLIDHPVLKWLMTMMAVSCAAQLGPFDKPGCHSCRYVDSLFVRSGFVGAFLVTPIIIYSRFVESDFGKNSHFSRCEC